MLGEVRHGIRDGGQTLTKMSSNTIAITGDRIDLIARLSLLDTECQLTEPRREMLPVLKPFLQYLCRVASELKITGTLCVIFVLTLPVTQYDL